MPDETTEIRQLFAQVVPEVASGVVEIKAVAREIGVRTKVAIFSRDPRVDCMAACVGVRGDRIRQIVERTNGAERIGLVRWDESVETFIANALEPAEVVFVRPDHLHAGRGCLWKKNSFHWLWAFEVRTSDWPANCADSRSKLCRCTRRAKPVKGR